MQTVDEALECDLGYRLPCSSLQLVQQYPTELQLSDGAASSYISTFLHHPEGSRSSEMNVQGQSHILLALSKIACPLAIIYQDQRDPSSVVRARPDASIMINGALAVKFEMKANEHEISTAHDELTSKFFPGAEKCFSRASMHCVGVAWAGDTVTISKLVCNDGHFDRAQKCGFNLSQLSSRLEFLESFFKILKWVAGIVDPVEEFHLAPAVKTATPNGHYVTWYGSHIVKHFHSFTLVQFERMKSIHRLNLSRVEHGKSHKQLTESSFEVTITRVGIPLRKALDRRFVSTESAFAGVEEGISQLHENGFAHTDLHIGNIFWDTKEVCVFLDDLEFLTPVGDPPRLNVANPRNIDNARELDLYQLSNLRSELGL